MQTKLITLECVIQAPDVVELLEAYDNGYLYYLDGKQLLLAPSLQVRSHSPMHSDILPADKIEKP